jgi:phosphoribosylformylglycinamidine cyclo-ligase
MADQSMTYATAGVDYEPLDAFKRMAQEAAKETDGNITRFGLSVVEASRGESVLLIDGISQIPGPLAHLEEGLGTKNLVADALYKYTKRSYYDALAQDTVAMVVNDMITLGALPLVVTMHLAAANAHWFKDQERCQDLVRGWRDACHLARCVWGGGETAILKDVVMHHTVVLSGSAVGIVPSEDRRILGDIRVGDAIVLLQSSGIHANGLTLARKIAIHLENGYFTPLPNGRSYWETLLDTTTIYVPILEDCQCDHVPVHYAVNITGHGWRKLMRHPKPFAYIVEDIGQPQPIFHFLQEHGNVSDREMYATFNMGAGFALYVPEETVSSVLAIAARHAVTAWRAGHVEEHGTERKVVLVPKGIEYAADSLSIR